MFKKINQSILMLIILSIACTENNIEGLPEGKTILLSTKSLNKNLGYVSIDHIYDFFNSDNSLIFEPKDEKNHFLIKDENHKVDFNHINYLVIEVYSDSDFSNVINLDFFKKGVQKGEPHISARIGINPRLKTKIIFPIYYLDGQEIFMQRFPRQLKGTVLGRRLSPQEIGQISIRLRPFKEGYYQPKLFINNVYLSANLPDPFEPLSTPIIDQLGQWKDKNWEDKTASEDEMVNRVRQLDKEISTASFPDGWSKFGGDKSLKLAGKGFFRIQQKDGKWFFVDPDGYAFLSTGVDVMNPDSFGPVDGIEDLFEWLPGEDKTFAAAVTYNRDQNQVSFLTSNLIRIFGENWRNKWEVLSANLMKTWRFNTIANWSDSSFIANQRLPYMFPLSGFPSTEIAIFRDFPDVFDPSYREAAKKFASQLEAYKNDTLLIGYFLRNEPHWGFGAHNLAYEMLSVKQNSTTKSACINWLSSKYNENINSLNEAWNTKFKDFGAIQDYEIDQLELSGKAEEDLWGFSGLMVDEYVKVVSEETKKVDPNHLNLGMRFASISTDLFYRTGAFVDVFSINQYSSPHPPSTDEIYKRTGKPVIIGEFHHGATDRGLPASGIRAAKNQEQRAVALRHYLEQGFARDEVIGMHYFQWNDQPWTGRYDGENYQIGVMDVTLQPYREWTEAAKTTNERLYDVATGKKEPFYQIIEDVPYIYY
jgi:hypothetical protein